jgi:hypothetical protein
MTEIIFASSFDDKAQPQNIFGTNKEFWTTTGLYPQELIIQFENSKKIDSISITSYGIRKIVIESCENDSATVFTKQAEMIDVPFSQNSLQEFFLNFNSSQNKVKILKIRVEAGYEDFCSINNVNFK